MRLGSLLLLACTSVLFFSNAIAAERTAWPEQSATTRPWSYWWWMGSGVDRENLTKELTRYRDAGMGGVHIIPIYGAKGYESKYITYLSPQWMDMLAHTINEARRLGLDVDMTTGTGWCFGGPNIPQSLGGMLVTVEAFDVPEGGPFTPKIEKGSRRRKSGESPSSQQLDSRAKIIALAARAADGKTIDVSARLNPSGTGAGPLPAGTRKVYALSVRPSGQAVKRAAPGGEGPMLNPFCAEAMRTFLGRFTQAFAEYHGPRPRAMYHDSYEYQNDWAPDLLAEFEKRRGYRLQDHLPLLAGEGEPDEVARIKCDYRETISDMMIENVFPQWTAWCRAHGIQTRNEAHGSPGNLLDLYALADIPETEMFSKDREILVSKFASSAAHVAGHRLVASETGTWLAEHFHETLGAMKQLVDELFLAGINHVVYHGTCYSPDEAEWPGWLFYAATEMNPRNSLWRDAPALNAYIARCQSILQAGRADNDLLVYWPIYDLWQSPKGTALNMTVHHRDWLLKQPVGATARRLWTRGYTFDFISDRQIAAARAVDGRIEVPGGRYRAVVVPPCEHMPPATYAALQKLAAAGAPVVFQDALPKTSPGLSKDAALRSLPQPSACPTLHVGDLEGMLAKAGVTRETLVDQGGLLFLRRATEAGHDYFVRNHGQESLDGWITPAVACTAALFMDPMTGQVGQAATRLDDRGRLQVRLQLPAGASIIVRTSKKPHADPAWNYWQPTGPATELRGTWRVEFCSGGPVLPKPYTTEKLASWTTAPDVEAQRFAGTAVYSLTFDAPAGGDRFLLDLGSVCHSARVRVNGRELGTLILPPYQLVVDQLSPRGNRLEIEVTGLAANRIRDLDIRGVAWRKFNDINFVSITYRPFDASKWPLVDCGLLGPVTLRGVRAEAVK